jgi:hypothetical protein
LFYGTAHLAGKGWDQTGSREQDGYSDGDYGSLGEIDEDGV